jgi:hypothetical protein
LVLSRGLLCSCHVHGLSDHPNMLGILKDIDSQRVKKLADGTLIIDDIRSPYDGMAISDYRKLSEEWCSAQKMKAKHMLYAEQEKARALGLPLPQMRMSGLGTKRIDKSQLPKWPEWAKNYKKQEREAAKCKE